MVLTFLARKGLGLLGKSKKVTDLQSKVISSVRTNVPKTKLEKASRDLDLAKHKYKASAKKTEITVDKINEQTKRINEQSKKIFGKK